MRLWWSAACVLAGCSFEGVAATVDGPPPPPPPDATGPRIADGLIGLWTLDEGAGGTVGETSGLAPLALAITDPARVTWVPGGLQLDAPVDINSGFGTNRLVRPCRDADAVTVEAWVASARLDQTGSTPGQPARVITLTVKNISGHSFSLGQLGPTWAGQVRTTGAGVDGHGSPVLANGVVGDRLTHLVLTSTATERRLYVDGVAASDDHGGLLDRWQSNGRTLALGGDPGQRNTWAGTIHLAAVYARALGPDEVMTNFRAGP